MSVSDHSSVFLPMWTPSWVGSGLWLRPGDGPSSFHRPQINVHAVNVYFYNKVGFFST